MNLYNQLVTISVYQYIQQHWGLLLVTRISDNLYVVNM